MAMTPAELEQISKDYKTIAEVTTAINFTHPVELADCTTVQSMLLQRLPPGYRVEVYHRTTDVVVEVRRPLERAAFYRREMIVTGF